MSTTLTNGLKLPDKGSVDWYADMQNNYSILDGAVGTIADHTTALAGKAPAVHTHTKSDITDFPAYGNIAGTICEGNDSRLSDARTPVAHTHTKSDVTDLFNSANVWGNTNTFTRNADDSFLLFKNTKINALVPTDTNSHYTDLNFFDVNSKIIGKVRSSGTRSRITTEITARSWSADGTTNEEVKLDLISDIQNSDKKTTINSNFIPSANNSYNLGSSSYQWNNLYAKNYYYNGVAWGLDKINEWSNTNYFNKTLFCDFSNLANKAIPNAYIQAPLIIVKGNTSPKTWHGEIALERYTNGDEGFQLLTGSYVNGTTQQLGALRYLVSGDGTESYCYSRGPTKHHLGTSTNKWTTLNGINPGALSLPKGGNTENIDWFDISSHITNVSGNVGANSYEAPSDGWIIILGKDEATSSIFIWDRAHSGICASAYGNGTQGAGRLAAILPVRKGMNMGIICKFSSASDLYFARFYPCEGNV